MRLHGRPVAVLGIGALLGYFAAAGIPAPSLQGRRQGTTVARDVGSGGRANDLGAACSPAGVESAAFLAMAGPRPRGARPPRKRGRRRSRTSSCSSPTTPDGATSGPTAAARAAAWPTPT